MSILSRRVERIAQYFRESSLEDAQAALSLVQDIVQERESAPPDRPRRARRARAPRHAATPSAIVSPPPYEGSDA